MIYLLGEWVLASVGLGLAFMVATAGAIGLGWWVVRKDRQNRRLESSTPEEPAGQH